MNHRAYVAAVGLLIFVAAANAQTRDHNEIVRVPNEDPEMATAIAKARATLDDFLVLWRAQPSGASDYKLKVRISDGENSEHFWVQPFRPLNSGFEGILANEPKLVKNVRGGQRITFQRGDITDWGYVRGGKQIGSFTVCALFRRAPKEQVEYYRKNYGFTCEP
ncbi:DUF2314 domain-containing protein [Variovorax beijingensis]|uniref:DUF2314 domain-containing protein n=1 Tax=Variovorax beijingensis TaxID=2496117 RepID=A0ABX9ZWM2_9BURK|nr:DUF2314 domain-containing protein [Variovorax beijingensis]RSZ24073.1 DUF2314 domain-containing protein [Variovorax beijingensis]